MLSGDNSILSRAVDAKNNTVVGQEKEQVEIEVEKPVSEIAVKEQQSQKINEVKTSVKLPKTGM